MAIDKRVFPTSSRTGANVDLGTNLVTEYNIASITNKMANTESYVIASGSNPTPDSTIFTSGNDLEFIIYGYYFILNSFDPTLNSWDTDYVNLVKNNNEIKAQICLLQDQIKSYNYLVPVDDSGWSSSKELTILKYNGTNWIIPDSSRIIFNGYSINNLDEGTL